MLQKVRILDFVILSYSIFQVYYLFENAYFNFLFSSKQSLLARLAMSNSEPRSPTARQVGPWSDFIVVSSVCNDFIKQFNSSVIDVLSNSIFLSHFQPPSVNQSSVYSCSPCTKWCRNFQRVSFIKFSCQGWLSNWSDVFLRSAFSWGRIFWIPRITDL